MYCTNCGAEVSSDQKFCNKCGAPVIVSAVNVPSQQTAAPVADGNGAPVQFDPNYMAQPVAPKKSKVWPVVAIVLALLLVISVGVGFAIKKAYDYVKTAFDYAEEIEDIDDLDDLIDADSFDDFDEYFGDLEEYDEDIDYHEYEYAYATYMEDYVYIEGRDVINDSTKLYGGSDKTAGELCDFIDEHIMDDGYEIDRSLLYDLLELHLVDSNLSNSQDNYFEQSMMYCLTFANEFGGLDLEVDYCMYSTDEPTTYYYEIECEGEEETWIVDYSQKFLYMNDGDTEYESEGDNGMFTDDTLSMWLLVVDEFYDID